jgi:GT2 family glycosyltransferase
MMELSIIIVNWNSKEFLSACLHSVRRFTRGIEQEIIVIDSGSYDGADELLRNAFPEVIYIQSNENIGFARSNNAAFHIAKGKYILFLNPDTELTSPAINLMVEYIQNAPNAGAVGCKLLNSDNSVQTSCIQAFPTILGQFFSSEFLMNLFPASTLWGMSALRQPGTQPSEVEVISGACLMVHRAAFEAVDGFSEDYFMYTEDVDLCYKLQRMGLKNYYMPAATVKHFGGGSSESAPSNFSAIMMRDSIMRYFKKYRGSVYANVYRFSTLVTAVLRIVISCVMAPLKWPTRSTEQLKGTVRKWISIMQWSLNPMHAYKNLTQKTSST